MGTVFKLPVVHVTSLVETLNALRTRHNIRSLAAHPHGVESGSQPDTPGATLQKSALHSDCCIVFGSEGEGISPGVLAACDASIAIPMHNGIDSLNVASASAVFFYEVMRQRKKE